MQSLYLVVSELHNEEEMLSESNGFHLDSKEPDWSKLLTALIME